MLALRSQSPASLLKRRRCGRSTWRLGGKDTPRPAITEITGFLPRPRLPARASSLNSPRRLASAGWRGFFAFQAGTNVAPHCGDLTSCGLGSNAAWIMDSMLAVIGLAPDAQRRTVRGLTLRRRASGVCQLAPSRSDAIAESSLGLMPYDPQRSWRRLFPEHRP